MRALSLTSRGKTPQKPDVIGQWNRDELVKDLESYEKYSNDKVNSKSGISWLAAKISLELGERKGKVENIIAIAKALKANTYSNLWDLRCSLGSCYDQNQDGELAKVVAVHYWRLEGELASLRDVADAKRAPTTASSNRPNGAVPPPMAVALSKHAVVSNTQEKGAEKKAVPGGQAVSASAAAPTLTMSGSKS
mgnify:CR=1 FL=1